LVWRVALYALGVGGGVGRLDALVHEQVELDGPELEGELARVGLGEEEQVADEVEQPAGVPVDDAEVALLLVAERAVLLEQLDVAADRGQRSPQLVRDERDELVLHPVELAQLVGVLAEAPVARLELPRDPVEDREEREVEREQRQTQDPRQTCASG